jgi:multicomponent Na+:H+ antiporter subunit C
VAVWLALVIGCLYAAGVYMLLRRSLFKLVLGLVLISHGANLLIFTAGGLTRAEPPVVPAGRPEVVPPTDPLPQALILTAIVISFAVIAFTLVLFHRGDMVIGSNDPDAMRMTDHE